MKRELRRCVEIILNLVENIVDEKDDPNEDVLLDELDVLRETLNIRDKKIIQRLFHSIGYVDPKEIEIDEADSGSSEHWLG